MTWLRILVLLLMTLLPACVSPSKRQELLTLYQYNHYLLGELEQMGAAAADPISWQQAQAAARAAAAKMEAEKWRQAEPLLLQLASQVEDLSELLKTWDPDGDGLSSYAEYMLHGTSWQRADTDGDGFPDRMEIFELGTDPRDHCSIPLQVTPPYPVVSKCSALEDQNSPLK